MSTVENLARNVPGFTSNAFLVDGDRTTLVDAGNDFDIVDLIDRRSDGLDALVLTHTHPDHIGNVPAVVEAFDVDVWGFDPEHELVDHEIRDGDTITIGDDDYGVLHTPGHKNDHVCLYAATSGTVFAGDLVFANGGFGRTDLPEGNRDRLVESIEYLLSTVGDSVSRIHPGHGPTIDTEPKQQIELALQAARF